MAGSGLATGFEGVGVNLTRAGLMALVGAGFSLAIWRITATPGRAGLKIGLLGLGVVLAVGLHTAIDMKVDAALRTASHEPAADLQIISDSPLRAVVMELIANSHVVVFVALHAFFTLAALALRWSMEARERDAQLAAARTAAVSAQLSMLRHQLNPHFIFNTLNAIGSLVATGRNAAAEEMIDRLSGFLRASLGADVEPFTTLDDEFATLQAYLEIEAVRFGDRLSIAWELPAELREAKAPSLLMQPLVENAVKHAVSPAMRPVRVRIVARREGAVLVLGVTDTGAEPGASTSLPGTGTGLRNVRERLALLYGDRAELAAGSTGEGFAAWARLPLETMGPEAVA